MKRQLPWWLNPWKAYRRLDQMARWQDERLKNQQENAQKLRSELIRKQQVIQQLEANLRAALNQKTGGISMEQAPEFVMVGIERGNGSGKRIIASKELGSTSFGMTPIESPPPRWMIESVLSNALFVDAPTYGAALDRVAHIWANWERDKPQPAELTGQGNLMGEQPKAIEQ
jgi:hypothetical protein